LFEKVCELLVRIHHLEAYCPEIAVVRAREEARAQAYSYRRHATDTNGQRALYELEAELERTIGPWSPEDKNEEK
jgi:hypothetical protein